jgi:protein phosphatase
MRVEATGQTDVGLKRGHNEDTFFMAPEHRLFMVADGMGGHRAGEVASQMAVETVRSFFDDTAGDDELTWPFKMERSVSYDANRLAVGVKLANLRIHETAQSNAQQRGMGTTIVTAHFTEGTVVVAHVGDSRLYRFRAGKLTQLTEDHSLLNDYIKMKDLTPEQIENFPHKNVIVRALGMKETVQVDILSDRCEANDIYLLCSDGLSGMITDPRLAEILADEQHDLQACCDTLIREANANGGTDNITAILARVSAD